MQLPHWLRPPPPIRLPKAVGRFDQAVDQWFEDHLRGRAAADAVFYGASALGDHGIIWFVFAAAQTARRAVGLSPPATSHRGQQVPWWAPLVRDAVGLSVESVLVNGPVKWLFRRRRPTVDGGRPRYLRQPRTSSFPSGHATSAFFAAALLRDDAWPLYYLAAVLVAASRVHVKIHHASDVLGGAAIGVALGEWTRHMLPMESTRPFRR